MPRTTTCLLAGLVLLLTGWVTALPAAATPQLEAPVTGLARTTSPAQPQPGGAGTDPAGGLVLHHGWAAR